jgi:hypothetical protein
MWLALGAVDLHFLRILVTKAKACDFINQRNESMALRAFLFVLLASRLPALFCQRSSSSALLPALFCQRSSAEQSYSPSVPYTMPEILIGYLCDKE